MSFTLYDLQCEYRETPLAVSTKTPRFSWKMRSNEIGQCQAAYRIVVSGCESTATPCFWDTGKVMSADQFGIRYSGKELSPFSEYVWSVTVWNDNGEMQSKTSRFGTGVFSLVEWPAKWITAERADGPIHARTAFSLNRHQDISSALLFSATTTGAFGNLTVCVNDVYLTLNGQKVGRDVVTPGQISEKKWRAVYRAYDVTEMLKKGENVLGAVLVSMAYSAFIQIRYRDNSQETLLLSDKFKTNGAGPYRLWDDGVADQSGKKRRLQCLERIQRLRSAGLRRQRMDSPSFYKYCHLH